MSDRGPAELLRTALSRKTARSKMSSHERSAAMAKVTVGLVGCGFVAELHMYAYQRVYGLDAQVAAVAARGDHVLDFAKKHRIPRTYRDFNGLLADKEIDVVDICTPPALHAEKIVEAMQAGKHVNFEKPFTGYFGRGDDRLRSASTCRNR